MNTRLGVIVLSVMSFCVVDLARGDTSDQFPAKLEAETLLAKKLSFPSDLLNQKTWFVLGFTKGAKENISTCRDKLEALASKRGFAGAVLEGAPFFIRGLIVSSIRSTVPVERRDGFLIFTDHEKELKALFRYTEAAADDAYILGYFPQVAPSYVLKPLGHGNCDPAMLETLKTQILTFVRP